MHLCVREPVLLAPNFNVPCQIAANACDMGDGVLLFQVDAAGLDRQTEGGRKR